MNRIFAITAASEPVSIGGDGLGEITFTVTNISESPLRGQLFVRPLGSTKGEWLSLAGESERDFSPNAAQPVVVKVSTPPGAPAGKYQFRLDAISVINPDDDFTVGPTIDLEVKATEAPKKAFPWWIIAAAAGAVILIGALTWLLWPTGVEVPEVVGLDVGEATKKIEDLKLKVEVTRQANAEVAAGRILSQEPAGKSEAEEGATIKLLVAEQKAAENKPAEPKVEEPPKVEGLPAFFEDNFENGVKPGWSQTKTEMTPNGRTSFLGQFWNEGVALTLNNVPPHKSFTLTLDLYVLHTWEGAVPTFGPDIWGVRLVGNPDIVVTNFSNQDGGRQKFACKNGEEVTPTCQQAGAEATFGAVAVNSLGFNSHPLLKNKDCVYKIKRTFTHNSADFALVFFSNLVESDRNQRNANNESWGLDNVRIDLQ